MAAIDPSFIQHLTLEDKIGQMLLAGFEGLYPPDYILEWLAQGRIGGVILFARNVENPSQLAQLTKAVHQSAKYPAFVAIDQEGGSVARLREPNGFTESPGAMALSAAHSGDKIAEEVSYVLASEMQAVGINWTFAPAVDISYNAENPTVGTRSFGKDTEQVSEMAASVITGFQRGGVAACAKHFPGLGNTAIDTHLALASLDTSLAQLVNQDLLPYRAAIQSGVAAIMTTHTVFTALDAQYPATLSPVVIKRLIRQELGYDGVVCSDCMEMQAISSHFPPEQSVVLAALAGIDAILFSHTRTMQEAAYNALLEAVQTGKVPIEIVNAANARIAEMKAKFPAQSDRTTQEIGSHSNTAIALEAARAGMVLLRDPKKLVPITASPRTVVVEIASYLESEVMERGDATLFGKQFQERFPAIALISLKAVDNPPEVVSHALEVTRESELLILATRNAHLIEEELALVQPMIDVAKKTILVCLRNPYDAEVLEADAILCTCGDSAPSLQAAVEALAGDYVPSGVLPVTLKLHPI